MHGVGQGKRELSSKWSIAMSDPLSLGRSVLASQPFSSLVGAELTAFAEGRAEIRIPIRDDLKQQHGFVHGGVVSYAADNALTFAGGSALGAGVVTSEFKINYLRPATGDYLIARAQVIHAGKNQAVCRCDVFCTDGEGERLCATSQGTITRLGSPSAENHHT
jgi:uncharacterized protein (TIGR00369 family)